MAGFTEYENYDAVGLADLVSKNEVSAAEVLDAAIERADAHDPALNAIVNRYDDQARASVASGLPKGPLTGVPFLLKDLNLLAEGMVTTHSTLR